MSIKLPLVFSIVAVVFKGRADLIAENLALRHQLSCLGDRKSRPRLRRVDRVFWVLLSRFWNGWRESLVMVKPATVLAWHRKGALVHESERCRRILRFGDLVHTPIAKDSGRPK